MTLTKRLAAEFLGTLWLVLGGCGSAVLAANFGGDSNPLGIGFLGGAGLRPDRADRRVRVRPYLRRPLQPGGEPGALGGRFPAKDLLPYIVAQVVGAIVAGFILLQIARGGGGFSIDPTTAGAFASNGYGVMSPGGYTLAAAFLCELVLTAFFLVVIMGATHGKAAAGFAPIAIGLALTLIHLISIPVTNTSVNPARSTGVALFAGSGALGPLWLFWVAPLAGGALGGILYAWLRPANE